MDLQDFFLFKKNCIICGEPISFIATDYSKYAELDKLQISKLHGVNNIIKIYNDDISIYVNLKKNIYTFSPNEDKEVIFDIRGVCSQFNNHYAFETQMVKLKPISKTWGSLDRIDLVEILAFNEDKIFSTVSLYERDTTTIILRDATHIVVPLINSLNLTIKEYKEKMSFFSNILLNMNKQFTIKDLLYYNNPCKSCNAKTKLALSIAPLIWNSNGAKDCDFIYEGGKLHFNLVITYKKRLDLVIDVNNQYYFSNKIEAEYFKKFLQENAIYINIYCNKCQTLISTNDLIFDGVIIKPITILTETICYNGGDKQILLSSNFDNSITRFVVYKDKTNLPEYELELPIIPLYECKNNKELVQKLNLLLAFS